VGAVGGELGAMAVIRDRIGTKGIGRPEGLMWDRARGEGKWPGIFESFLPGRR
jgi:hypothetical protein